MKKQNMDMALAALILCSYYANYYVLILYEYHTKLKLCGVFNKNVFYIFWEHIFKRKDIIYFCVMIQIYNNQFSS
jgi:hypothetical protein